MVYRGKPSAACAECRKLRSRCDKRVPACGQCIKAGRGCSGYRNTVDLMFHDESTRVVSQNRGRNLSCATTASTHDGILGPAKRATSTATTTPIKLAGFMMYQPLDDLGVNVFMSSFVAEDPAISLLHYLPDFYAKTGFASPALSQIVTAVGLVSLAKSSHSKDMCNVAVSNYGAAIRSINAALLNPNSAGQDSILASIFVAAMFEALIIPQNAYMGNCCTHLAGAVSVALLIFKEEKQTDVTIKQCTTLIKTVIMNCWTQNVFLPPNFIKFKKLVERRKTTLTIYDQLLDIMTEIIIFREELRDAAGTNPMAMIRRALEIDVTLDNFGHKLELEAPFKTIELPIAQVEQLAYEGCFHVYPQPREAHLWNNVRSSRIRLHQVIHRQCETLTSSPHVRAQQKTSDALIISQATEMVASVPQVAGYLEELNVLLSPTRQAGPLQMPTSLPMEEPEHRCPPPSEPYLRSPSLYLILYQLYMLHDISCLPQHMKAWIQGRIVWMEEKVSPLDLQGLIETVRQKPWDLSPVSEELEYASFRSKLVGTSADAIGFEAQDTRGMLPKEGLGGKNILHREAVSASGMYSCCSVGCSMCN
ncbi:hypothetical protein BDW02DRAFT_98056 [Decorospora gaudefroyi]|uniref:Zn(2)-C6 fungal-type domain-containing protein n=1 Tax=Decorospora gaudefroyi TaxID=184978 RepID=A0A6A5KQ70_9PLEO|nr:hypothetical protein BDW02DRAFT_98056 [Decorospora gaudefroyi]